MKQNLFKTIAVGAVLAGSIGAAQASGSSAQSNWVQLNIAGMCTLGNVADVNLHVGPTENSAVAPFNPMVICNDQLPYTLDLLAMPFGEIFVDKPGGQHVISFEKPDGSPWGSIAYGDELSGVGTGQWQTYYGRATFNLGTTYKPEIGHYVGDGLLTVYY